MGEHDKAGQPKPIVCTLLTCQQRFETIKGMQRHKSNDPAHSYCKRCDVDCEDFEDLKEHKVNAMKPFLYGIMRHDPGARPKHIVCEICGEDFKCFGGRKRHRKLEHPAQQDLVCEACHACFIRAGDLIYHYETDQCPHVSSKRFMEHVEQRVIHERIWQCSDTISENLAHNQRSKELALLPLVDEDQDNAAGGVDLLGYEEESERLSIKPLQAQFDLIDVQGHSDTTDATTSSRQSSRRNGGTKIHMEPFPALSSAGRVAASPAGEEAGRVGLITIPSPATPSGAWTNGNTSQAIFAEATTTTVPGSGYWANILNERQESITLAQGPSLIDCRWWDPRSRDYDADIFYNHVTHRYCCPFEGCETAAYEKIGDLEGHMQWAHLQLSLNCPLCGRRFQSCSELVAHSEVPAGRCKLKDSKVFGGWLHKVSGGFLEAEHLRPPTLARGAQLQPGGGLMSLKFTTKIPERKEIKK